MKKTSVFLACRGSPFVASTAAVAAVVSQSTTSTFFCLLLVDPHTNTPKAIAHGSTTALERTTFVTSFSTSCVSKSASSSLCSLPFAVSISNY